MLGTQSPLIEQPHGAGGQFGFGNWASQIVAGSKSQAGRHALDRRRGVDQQHRQSRVELAGFSQQFESGVARWGLAPLDPSHPRLDRSQPLGTDCGNEQIECLFAQPVERCLAAGGEAQFLRLQRREGCAIEIGGGRVVIDN